MVRLMGHVFADHSFADDPMLSEAGEEGGTVEVATPKREINVGSEYLKKVETLYCELCRIYLNHRDDPEKVLKDHCGVRSHLRAFLRQKEDRTVRKDAVQKKESDEKKEKEVAEKSEEKEEEQVTDDTSSMTTTQNESETKVDDLEGDDKLWADVDKDLGDLLNEVQPEGEENDDEDDEDSRQDNERLLH